jgi:enamine deaminase RidA (YjgF/YER057c/UK114 family)
VKQNKRINISSGAKWESIIGYSRAVRVGNLVEVAGTTATEGDTIIRISDRYVQTKYILGKMEKALIEAGCTMQDVVRTRIFTTDISRWEAIAKAQGEFFKDIRPAATMVEVKALIDPALLVEIEASAILPNP